MFCKFCGTQINDDDLFCPNCGQRRANVASGVNSAGTGTTQQQTANATQTPQQQITPSTPKTEIDKKVFMFMGIGAAITLINLFLPDDPWSICFSLLFPIVYVIICMIINKYDFKSGALISLGMLTGVLFYSPSMYLRSAGSDSTTIGFVLTIIPGLVYEGIQLLAVFITSKIIQKNKITS